jgi:hypothetical protein
MVENKIPYTNFLPSKKLIWDIMRACIGVKKPEDLWFHEIEY